MAKDIISKISGSPLSPKFLAQTGVAALLLLVTALHIVFSLETNTLAVPANLPVIFLGTLVVFSSITIVSTFPYLFWIIFGRASDWMVTAIAYCHLSDRKTLTWPFVGLVRTFSNGYFFEETRLAFSIQRDNFIIFSMKVGHMLSSFHNYSRPYNDISYLISSIIVVILINFAASIPFIDNKIMAINAILSLLGGFLLLLIFAFVTVLVYLDALRVAFEILMDDVDDNKEPLDQEAVLKMLKISAIAKRD